MVEVQKITGSQDQNLLLQGYNWIVYFIISLNHFTECVEFLSHFRNTNETLNIPNVRMISGVLQVCASVHVNVGLCSSLGCSISFPYFISCWKGFCLKVIKRRKSIRIWIYDEWFEQDPRHLRSFFLIMDCGLLLQPVATPRDKSGKYKSHKHHFLQTSVVHMHHQQHVWLRAIYLTSKTIKLYLAFMQFSNNFHAFITSCRGTLLCMSARNISIKDLLLTRSHSLILKRFQLYILRFVIFYFFANILWLLNGVSFEPNRCLSNCLSLQ